MAAEYFLYSTPYNNTLVDRSETSFAPLPPDTGEIYIDYFIPTIQPLYLYRESGATIVLNDQDTINAYLASIAPPPQPEDNVLLFQFTGYTATTDVQLTGIDSDIVYLSGQTDIKLPIDIFTGYTASTIGVTATRKFSAGKLNDLVISTTQSPITNWNTEESFSNTEFYSWDASLGELTFLKDGFYDIVYNTTLFSTALTNRSNARSIIQEDLGAGFIDIAYTRRDHYNRQLNYGASTSTNILREYSEGDKIRATSWRTVGTTTISVIGDGTTLNVVKSEVGINTLQYTGTTDQFVEKTDYNAYTAATQTQIDALEANVYGTEYQLASSLASSTSTATTPQTKVTMTTTDLPSGTYKVYAAWRASHTSASNSTYSDVTIGGIAQGTRSTITKEWKDTSNIESLSTVFYVTLSGVNTILLRYWNEGSSTTISDATIEVIRVA